MKSVLEFLRNLLILEAALFAPGMVAIFGFMPDRLDVALDTDAPITVSVGFVAPDENGGLSITGEQCAGVLGGKNQSPISYYFADDFNVDSFRIGFSGNNPRFAIKEISLVRNLLVRFRLPTEVIMKMDGAGRGNTVSVLEDGSCLVESDGSGVVLKSNAATAELLSFNGFELPSLPGVQVLFWAFQAFLCFLSLLAIVVKKRIRGRPNWRLTLFVSAVGAFFFAVVLPAQTIFGNRDVFEFPLMEIVTELALALLGCWVVFSLMLYLLSRLFAYLPHILFTALVTYEYLHTGILSAGHPSLNGSLVFYMTKANAIPDFIWLAGIFIGFLIFGKWLKTRLHWVLLALLVMSVASLFDVRSALQSVGAATKKSVLPWQHTNKEVADDFRLSPTRNVILLIPDSNQSDASFEVIQKDEVLRAEFSGFCAFNNNIGMHEDTRTAIPGILSGEWCSDPDEGETYLAKIFKERRRAWGESSVVSAFERAGLPVYVITGCDGLAHSNRVEHRDVVREIHASEHSIFFKRTSSMGLCLMDCYRFRIVPFILKQWSLRISFLGLGADDGTGWERTLYPLLSVNPLSDEQSTSLTILHAGGSHAPVHFDADGNRIYSPDKDSYKGYCGQVHFTLKCIAGFLRDLKRKGVYDNSLIIIVGDHGIQDPMANWPDTGDVPSGAMPMLWVKPMHIKGEMTFSEIPTSHSKIAEVIKRSIEEDLTQEQIAVLLYTEIRHFRKGRDFDTEFKDMYFDDRGTRIK